MQSTVTSERKGWFISHAHEDDKLADLVRAFLQTLLQVVGRPDHSWVERYNRLCTQVRPRVLADDAELPIWLRSKARYIWQRNLWMLFTALALDAPSLTLIALWDGGPADGPGGTKHLFELVKSHGHKVERLPAERLKEKV